MPEDQPEERLIDMVKEHLALGGDVELAGGRIERLLIEVSFPAQRRLQQCAIWKRGKLVDRLRDSQQADEPLLEVVMWTVTVEGLVQPSDDVSRETRRRGNGG